MPRSSKYKGGYSEEIPVEWQWGSKDRSKSKCYLMEIIMDALKISNYDNYRLFLKDNVMGLCLHIGNMSSFFRHINRIIGKRHQTRELKIFRIMNVRNEEGLLFIDERAATLIYNAMTLEHTKRYIRQSGGMGRKKKNKEPVPGEGGEPREPCYRKVTKGKVGYNSMSCESEDDTTCSKKAKKCPKGQHCSILIPEFGFQRYLEIGKAKKFKSLRKRVEDGVVSGECVTKDDSRSYTDFDQKKYTKLCDLRELQPLCELAKTRLADRSGTDDKAKEMIEAFKGNGEGTYDKAVCGPLSGLFYYNTYFDAKREEMEVPATMDRSCKKLEKAISKLGPDGKTVGMKDKMGKLGSKGLDGLKKGSSMAAKGAKSLGSKMGKGLSAASKSLSQGASMGGPMGGPMGMSGIPGMSGMSGIPGMPSIPGMGAMKNIGSMLNPMHAMDSLEEGLERLGKKLGKQMVKFSKGANTASKQALEMMKKDDRIDIDVKTCLPYLPKLFMPSLFRELSIPLNVNDVLLMGFSVFPYIGWIFDIFMIFRALLEGRWLYAILMTINWYQWFFWKIFTFGIANVDLGPLFKIFYLGPTASRYFTFSNVTNTFIHFVNEMTGNMPSMIEVTAEVKK